MAEEELEKENLIRSVKSVLELFLKNFIEKQFRKIVYNKYFRFDYCFISMYKIIFYFL
jgi:hypothetical protein